MKRYAEFKQKAKNRVKKMQEMGMFDHTYVKNRRGIKSGGRCYKTKPLDCGKSKCHLCHSEKLLNREKARYKREKQRFEDEVKDMGV